jgi:hypothetical protein
MKNLLYFFWIFNFVYGASIGGAEESRNSIRMLTLNLHGYHPTDELPRWFQSKEGTLRPANPDIFFFKQEELSRGHTLRLDRLAKDINLLAPDIVFFQEVGAGAPDLEKNCNTFFRRDLPRDSFELNSVVRLHQNLMMIAPSIHYNLSLACRGNIGWNTDNKLFLNQRIVTFPENNSKKTPHIVFDFNANPYPSGIIVEGLAVLVKDTWSILGEYQWKLPINRLGDTFFTQVVVVRQASSSNVEAPWLALVNIHGVHKLRHFEAAIKVREELDTFIRNAPWKGKYLGAIILILFFFGQIHYQNQS